MNHQFKLLFWVIQVFLLSSTGCVFSGKIKSITSQSGGAGGSVVTLTAASNYVNIADQHAVSYSGTCSQEGGTVQVLVDSVAQATTATCTSGAWSLTLDMSAFTEGSHAIEAQLGSTSSGSVSQTKDSIAPSAPTLTVAGGSSWSDKQSPQLSWTTSTDTGTGVLKYQLALGTTPGGTDIQNFADVGNVTSYQFSEMNFTRGQAYYPSLRVYDGAGNVSIVVQGSGWVVTKEMWTTNGTVYSMAKGANTLYVGGNFTAINEWTGSGTPIDLSTGLLKWPDANNKAKVSGTVYAAVADGNGGFYIGGSFTSVFGLVRTNLAHILPNGTLDAWSPNPNNTVLTLVVDGTTLYVGGSFTSLNSGTTRNRLASFDTTSGTLTSWNPNANAAPISMVVQGGTLYVGGAFTSLNGGTTRNYLASFDTTTGALSSWNPNGGASVRALAISGSVLYAGGDFTSMNGGTTRNYLASFDTTTGNLTAWDPNANTTVNSLLVSGTTLYVGGAFTSLNGGTTRNYLASFDTTNGNLNSWDPNANTSVYSISINGTNLYVGGAFSSMNGGTTRNRLASFDTTTGNLSSWNPNANGVINALAISGGVLFAGGSFTNVNGGVTRNNLASFDLTTGDLNSWNPNSSAQVSTLAVLGANLYVGG
ncbi:MAG TPA: hypothetical protein VN132_11385, partial [Bdellovibrio sp.]|nr:hypothetical protein [Bdellovibrio sp.]